MTAPRIAYLAESGFQHAFPIEAMLRVLPAPVYTTGQRLATRFAGRTPVVHDTLDNLAARMATDVDIVLSTSQRFDPAFLRSHAPRLRVVHIGHGESDKTFGSAMVDPKPTFVTNPVNRRFDLMLVGTQWHADRCVNAHHELVGYLKHDLFVANGYATRAPEPNWILWAPSFGRHSAVPQWLDAVVDATGRLGLTLILHFHPHSYEHDPHLILRAQAEVLRHRHVRIAAVANILDAMARAALFLGDVSSTSYDWLMFDRPAVFLDHEGLAYDVEKAVFATGVRVAPGDDVASSLAAELAAPGARSSVRQAALAKRFPILDGRASERAAAAVMRYWNEHWS